MLSVGTYGSAHKHNVGLLIWVNDKYHSSIETVTNSFIKDDEDDYQACVLQVALSYHFPNKRPGRLFGQKL